MKKQRRIHPLFYAFAILLLLSAGRMAAAAPGDVTGDGAADGRDALMIMRHVDGLETLSPEQQAEGDVAPVPGTGGRDAGDGAITEEDALRILCQTLGLAAEGETTGNYAGSTPRILDFTPKSGPVGTVVTIIGRNFVGAWPGEDAAFIGGAQASIQTITGSKIVAAVPADAVSGIIQVHTPGGVASSSPEFTVTQSVSGRVDLGAGLNPADFTVVSVFAETTPDASTGEFSLNLPVDRLAIVGAAPKGPGMNVFLAMRLPEEKDGTGGKKAAAQGDPLVVDAQSTAYSLIFMHPFLMTRDMSRVRALLDLMAPLPAVQNLVSVVARRYPQGANGLDDPEVEAAWGQAVAAVLSVLPSGTAFNIASAGGGKVGRSLAWDGGAQSASAAQFANRPPDSFKEYKAAKTVKVSGIDLDYLKFRYDAGEGAVMPALQTDYSPVDWLVAIYRLDPRDMPEGIGARYDDLKKRNIKRENYEKSTLVAGNLWTAKIDVLGQGMDFVMGTVLDWVGLGGGDPNLPIPDGEDAIYMIRAFSGSFKDRWQFSGDDAVAMKAVTGDVRMGNYATCINVTVALVDVWSLVAGPEGKPSKEAIKTGFQNALAAISKEFGGNSLGDLSAKQALQSILTIVVEAGKGVAVAYAKEGLSQAQNKLQGTLQKALGKAVPLLEILYKVSLIGKIGERIVGLRGYIVSPLDLEIVYGPTPLETAFVLVGDPFTPIIDSISPNIGGPLEEITLAGQRFDPDLADNKVWFGSTAAEVVSVNPDGTHLKVRVPAEGLREYNNPYTIYVETPAALKKGSKSGFTFRDIPVLTSLSVLQGYGASTNPVGKPYSDFTGTEVMLNGWKFNKPSSGPNIEVYFGATKATIIQQSSVALRVNVPSLQSTGPHDVYVRYQIDGRWEETRHLSFNVFGPPQISSVTPTTAPAGALLEIQGQNFNTCQVLINDTNVYARNLDGQNRLIATMPNVGDDGQQVPLEVWSPAGSAQRQITRQAGLKAPDRNQPPAGLKIPVQTDSAGQAIDGKITMDEAMALARGSINFWDGGLYDDKNQEYTQHWQEFRSGTDPDYVYWWEQTSTDTKTLDANNGPAHELRKHYRVDHFYSGTVSSPYLLGTEDLDSGVDTQHKVEEGDYCIAVGGNISDFRSYNGADYMDVIETDTGTHTYFTDAGIHLGRYDQINFANTSIIVHSGEISLEEGVWIQAVAIESSTPIRCQGNYVFLGPSFTRSTIEIRGGAGILIEQAFKVNLEKVKVLAANSDAITLINSGLCDIDATVENASGAGVHLTGSDENDLSLAASGCGGDGILLDNSRKNTITGFSASNCSGSGVKVSGGSINSISGSEIRACAAGISLENTERNEIHGTLIIRECTGNGITFDGGRGNKINGYTYTPVQSLRNGGNGLEIIDSSLNIIDGLDSAGNNGAGVVMRGNDTSWNEIWSLSSGRYCNLGAYTFTLLGNSHEGLHILGGANHNRITVTNQQARIVANSGHGVLVEGAGTSYNTLTCFVGNCKLYPDAASQGNGGDGIRFAGGASHNTVIGSDINGNDGNGVTFEGQGTEHNTITDSWIGSLVLVNGETKTPKPNLGMGVWMDAPARYVSLINTKIGIHNVGGVYCGHQTSMPPEGQWNAVLENCDIGWMDEVPIYNPAPAAAASSSAASSSAAAPVNSTGIGLQLDGTSYCRLSDVDIEYYNTGALLGGLPWTGNDIDIYAKDCTQDGVRIENAHDQEFYKLDSGSHQGNGIVLINCQNVFTHSGWFQTWDNAKYGVVIQNCENVHVDSGTWLYNLDGGMHITNSRQVIVEDSFPRENLRNGITIDANSDGIEIFNGFIDTNGDFGIQAVNSSNLYIHNIWVGDNLQGAIQINNCANVQIGKEQEGTNVNLGSDLNPTLHILGDGTKNVHVRSTNFYTGEPAPGIPAILVEGGSDILIGHSEPRLGNQIRGEEQVGILARGNVSNLRIYNNQIGPELRSTGYGIMEKGIVLDEGIRRVAAMGNTIWRCTSHGVLIRGGASENAFVRNSITESGGDGIRVEGAAARCNLFSQNIITSNAGKGIALAGGNDQIAAPVITNISPTSDAISGVINPVPPPGTGVEVYADRGDEGAQLLGISPVFGNNFSINSPVPPARALHAIAIHPDGNTSEFGPAIQEQLPNWNPFFYSQGEPGARNLLALDPDWPLAQTIVAGAGDDFDPQASVSGQGLVFVSDREGDQNLYYQALPSGTPVRVTFDSANEFDPSWRENLMAVAFASDRDGNLEIYKTALDLNNLPGTLQQFEGSRQRSASYSSGGGYFTLFNAGPMSLGAIEFYVDDAPAPFEWRIYEYGQSNFLPTALVASGVTTPTQTGWHRAVLDPPVSVPRPFVAGYVHLANNQPAFGVANAVSGGRYFNWDGEFKSWSTVNVPLMMRIPVDPPVPVRLTNHPATDRRPAWSPGGDRIAFESNRGGTADIWIMNADGSNPQRLTDGAGANTQPAWSPDGAWIAFVSNRDGNNEIYRIRASGGAPERLTQDPADDIDPAWSSNGQFILFSSNRESGYECYGMPPSGGGRVQRLTFGRQAATQPEAAAGNLQAIFGVKSSLALAPGANGNKSAASASVLALATSDVSATISLSNAAALPGENATILVQLQGVDSAGNLRMGIEYDPAILQVMETPVIGLGFSVFAMAPMEFPDDSGEIHFNGVRADGFTGGGEAMTIHFRVKSSARPGTSPLRFTMSEVWKTDLSAMPLAEDGGTLTVKSAPAQGSLWIILGQ